MNAISQESGGLYCLDDILALEQNFLRTYSTKKNEDSLYDAMSSTLALLKQIHESKGEVVSSYDFQRRTEPVGGAQ